MSTIKSELDFIYIYKGKRFLTEKEAIEYMELLKHVNNEKELIKEWTEKEKYKLIEKVWKDES